MEAGVNNINHKFKGETLTQTQKITASQGPSYQQSTKNLTAGKGIHKNLPGSKGSISGN